MDSEGFLTERDKLLIIAVASAIFLITVILTTCVVSPWCFLYNWIVKPRQTPKQDALNVVYPPFANGESQHFHLSIVPVYGSGQGNSVSAATSPFKQQLNPLNQFENLTHLAEKARIRYSSLKNDNTKAMPIFPKLEVSIRYQTVGESSIQLMIKIIRVYDLKPREYQGEPSPYVTISLVGCKTSRKSIISKVTQNQLFRTETVKRSHNATFVNSNFVSEELPKSLLREGSIKLRVMDDERYANDVCLGEVSIAMKKILLTDPGADQEETLQAKNQTVEEENEPVEGSGQPDLLVYTLFPIKEVKGELFVGFCYLPTSKRVNITVVKGSIRNTFFSQFNNNTGQQVFYIRLLMFNNGKMLQKKKSGASVRLAWDETISFDLPEQMNDNLSFMLVLASKFQNPTSPTLPESPESPESQPGGISAGAEEVREPSTTTSRNNSSSSRKDFFVGHFVLDKEAWNEEIAKRPRKQILKWHKIY